MHIPDDQKIMAISPAKMFFFSSCFYPLLTRAIPIFPKKTKWTFLSPEVHCTCKSLREPLRFLRVASSIEQDFPTVTSSNLTMQRLHVEENSSSLGIRQLTTVMNGWHGVGFRMTCSIVVPSC